MKKYFIIIISLLICQNSICQNLDYRSYSAEGNKVFSSVDSSYSNVLKALQVKNLTEVRCSLDSLGNVKDSLKLFHYTFDTLGRTIEKRFSFRSNASLYRSTIYRYVSVDSVKTQFNDPFGPDFVLDGMYVPDKFQSYCEQRDTNRQIAFIEIYMYDEQKPIRMNFSYYKSLQLNRKYWPKQLLEQVEYFNLKNNLHYKNIITYQFFED
jgi:hypothetical protein